MNRGMRCSRCGHEIPEKEIKYAEAGMGIECPICKKYYSPYEIQDYFKQMEVYRQIVDFGRPKSIRMQPLKKRRRLFHF